MSEFNPEGKCLTCKFWGGKRDINELAWNVCRQRAPVAVNNVTTVTHKFAVWPHTFPSEYCGDWEKYFSDAEILQRAADREAHLREVEKLATPVWHQGRFVGYMSPPQK